MDSEFIGWQVRLTTKSGSVIEGRVSSVDDSDSRLTLSDACIMLGKKSRQMELVSVLGTDITDLHVLKQKEEMDIFSDPAIVHAKPAAVTLSTSLQPSPAASPRPIKKETLWVNDDIKKLKQTEFDFQNNLLLFDKKKIFDDLRDTLRTEDLLITHNKAELKKPKEEVVKRPFRFPEFESTKLPNPSFVSPPRPSDLSIVKPDVSKKSEEEGPKRLPPFKPFAPPKTEEPQLKILQKREKKSENVEERKMEERMEEPNVELSRLRLDEGRLVVVGRGGKSPLSVPAITWEQMSLIEQRASKQTGPTTDQQLESASREIARVLLQQELSCLPGNCAILVGNHREGAVALAVGRHLVNRGVPVFALFLSPSPTAVLNDHVGFQKKLFMSTGGKLIEGSILPTDTFDLVIDGAVGREQSKEPSLLSSLSKGTFIAAIENPSGRSDAVFTLAFPKTIHINKSQAIYLIDIGLPSAAFKSVVPDVDPAIVFGVNFSVKLR